MRPLRSLFLIGSAAVLGGALAVSAVTAGATAAPAVRPAPVRAHLTARFLSEARAALVKDLNRNHGTAWFVHGRPGTTAGVANSSAAASFNWAGYADASSTHGTFTKVSGAWTVPSVTCTAEDRITSDWVGLDGFLSSTVEQDGTVSQCFEGRAVYYTWYEMYPAAPVNFTNTVKAGDHFSASVTFSGTKTYTLVLKDTTRGWTKTVTKSESGLARSSAEVITEAPSSESGVLPLADFGTINYSVSDANGTSLGGQNPTEIIMINNSGADKDSTSAISSGGAFSNTWIRAT